MPDDSPAVETDDEDDDAPVETAVTPGYDDRVWWRTHHEFDRLLQPDQKHDIGIAIRNYIHLRRLHIELTEFACSAMNIKHREPDGSLALPSTTVPTGFESTQIGFISSGHRPATNNVIKSTKRTIRCRCSTCPTCWHRRQAQVGKTVHKPENDAAFWYVAYTNFFSAGSRLPEKVALRLKGNSTKYQTLAWVVAPGMDEDSDPGRNLGAGYRMVLIARGPTRVNSYSPEVYDGDSLLGSVFRECFDTRAAAYQRWVDLNPHPGAVLRSDDAAQQCGLLDYTHDRKYWIFKHKRTRKKVPRDE